MKDGNKLWLATAILGVALAALLLFDAHRRARGAALTGGGDLSTYRTSGVIHLSSPEPTISARCITRTVYVFQGFIFSGGAVRQNQTVCIGGFVVAASSRIYAKEFRMLGGILPDEIPDDAWSDRTLLIHSADPRFPSTTGDYFWRIGDEVPSEATVVAP